MEELKLTLVEVLCMGRMLGTALKNCALSNIGIGNSQAQDHGSDGSACNDGGSFGTHKRGHGSYWGWDIRKEERRSSSGYNRAAFGKVL
jgi:hypothetical protein